ncbi:MAG: PIN domain-containing protein [Geodermatophilaceae bacterium]
MSRGVADTSVFIAQETERELGALPDEIAVSVVTAAELELGVLRAQDTETRARRLATLSRVRASYPLLPITSSIASRFAQIAAIELEDGRKLRRHDAWIAATAVHHGAAVLTQDRGFSKFSTVEVVFV